MSRSPSATRWTRPTRTTGWAFGLSVALTAGTASYLGSIYGELPLGIPVQFAGGIPFIYQMKTPAVVMVPVIVQLGLLAVFGALMLLLLWRARPSVGESHLDAVGDSERMRLATEGVALLACVWIAVQALGAARLIVLYRGGWGDFGALYGVTMITAVVASVVIAARTMKLVGNQRGTVPATDPSVWRRRNLYFNPSDPALFVATRTGSGWTLNFGRPLAIALLVGTLILGIGGPYLFARLILRGSGF